MKKILLLSYLLSITFWGFSQNVGIGTITPSQRLEVNGNINTSGNLMINGAAGANGQVLTMNGNSMQWMDKTRFRNYAFFETAGFFSIPPGVTEVLIEMWGGGGGGHNPGGGGGSGGYWTGLIPVTGITSITLTVGVGGNSGQGATAAGAGGNTSFTCTGFNVTTGGGGGADTVISAAAISYTSGEGGDGSVSALLPGGFRNYFYVNGMPGTPTVISYVQTATGVFNELYIGGSGGFAPFSGLGSGFSSTVLNTSPQRRSRQRGIQPANFGSGGTPNIFNNGADGGRGRVVIYY